MNDPVSLLAALGPTGILAAGLVSLVWWVARVSNRLDNLDHEKHGRVPKVEQRVDELEADVSEIKVGVAEIKVDTKWIREKLGDVSPAPTRKRRADA